MAGNFGLDGYIEAGSFSARQIVKPFSAWSRDFALSASAVSSSSSQQFSPWLADLFDYGGTGELLKTTAVRILASIQSLGSLVMLFLAGLAIRRTFGVS
jgi:hypothetical protein